MKEEPISDPGLVCKPAEMLRSSRIAAASQVQLKGTRRQAERPDDIFQTPVVPDNLGVPEKGNLGTASVFLLAIDCSTFSPRKSVVDNQKLIDTVPTYYCPRNSVRGSRYIRTVW
jgi:hypothetical protein